MDVQEYEQQLKQIEIRLSVSTNTEERQELLGLKDTISELLSLTNDISETNTSQNENPSTSHNDPLAEEYALFMAELETDKKSDNTQIKNLCESTFANNFNNDIKSLEGMRCRAPHLHLWGDIVYHNAMICSVLDDNLNLFESTQVRVLFTNPTHKEMLACPYYFDSECKFSEEKCRFSHGEVVLLSSLQEFEEPDFKSVSIGSKVLAKQSNNLWHRATIRRIFEEKFLIRFESVKNDIEIGFDEIVPLKDDGDLSDDDTGSNSENEALNEDIINMSLITNPGEALGHWEKYTRGIGTKLMQKMGYIVGTGLGKRSNGRTDPVTAVILPAGKSLDHCMKLRENAGGDKNLFSVERKMKRLQKQQEIRSKKAYEREKNKVDVFDFLNKTLHNKTHKNIDSGPDKSDRQVIRKETSRNLNIASLKAEEDIKRTKRDIYVIKESLTRCTSAQSQMHKSLKSKLNLKEQELLNLNGVVHKIKLEQKMRNDKKKLTVF